MAAVGQCPVLGTRDIAKEVLVIAGKADRVLIGRSADPIGFVNERMELGIACEEGQNEDAAASEGEKRVLFGHLDHSLAEVEAGFFLDKRAAVRLDGDVGETPERGGAVFEIVAGGSDGEQDGGEINEQDVTAEELATFLGRE